MDDPKAKPLELRDQIQLYATNECAASDHPVSHF
jgi:hypothetical protein